MSEEIHCNLCSQLSSSNSGETPTRIDVGVFVRVSLEESEDRFPSKYWENFPKRPENKMSMKYKICVKSVCVSVNCFHAETMWPKEFSVISQRKCVAMWDGGRGVTVGRDDGKSKSFPAIGGTLKKEKLPQTENSWWIDSLICFSLTLAIN